MLSDMPHNTRRVHFDDEEEPPSPSTSPSTILSSISSGPETPPPSFSFPQTPTIYRPPLPTVGAEWAAVSLSLAFAPHCEMHDSPTSSSSAEATPQVLLNSILAASPVPDTIACLSWDFKLSSRTALLSLGDAGPRSLSSAQLAESVTHPPQPRLMLRLPGYPWSVEVTPYASEPHVTVRDVLSTLYANLHRSVSAEEHAASGDLDTQSRVDSSFELRISRVADRSVGEAERAKGVRRLDYLLGADHFNGLCLPSRKMSGDEWEVQVRAG